MASEARAEMVQHKGRQRQNAFGGTTFTTLCNRMNRRSVNGMNIANSDAEVTCKFCLSMMRQSALLATVHSHPTPGDSPCK